MNVVYGLQDIRFEWDRNKAQGNFEKHGVTFEEAVEVFSIPFIKVAMQLPTVSNVISSSVNLWLNGCCW